MRSLNNFDIIINPNFSEIKLIKRLFYFVSMKAKRNHMDSIGFYHFIFATPFSLHLILAGIIVQGLNR